MMDSFRLSCNNGFAIQKAPVRNTIATTKRSSVGVVPQSTTVSTNTNCHITNNNNINIIASNNYDGIISSQPPNINLVLQQPSPYTDHNNISRMSQQVTYLTKGPSPFRSIQTSSSSPYTLTSDNQLPTTSIGSVSSNCSFATQSVIIGAPNSVFLPSIGTTLARPPVINIDERPGFLSGSPILLNNELPTSSINHLNKINVPNAFHYQNNPKQQLNWDFSPSSTSNQQKSKKTMHSNMSNTQSDNKTRSDPKLQHTMISFDTADHPSDIRPRIPQRDPSLTDTDLVKLMAVLNNPALTLTPVSASSCSMYMPNESNVPHEINSRLLLKSPIGLRPQMKPVQSFVKTKPGESNNQPPKSVFNIIQSTQNMRPNILNRPQICNQSAPTSNVYIIPSKKYQMMSSNKDSSQSINESSLMDKVGQIDKNKFSSSKLADNEINQPTFISTSVKNIIMQQPALSSNLGSDKSISISKHLLKHIADHNKEVNALQTPIHQNLSYRGFHNEVNNLEDNIRSLSSTQSSINCCDNLSQINKVSDWMNQSSVDNQQVYYDVHSYSRDDNLFNEWSKNDDRTNFQSAHSDNQHSFHDSLADPEDIFINRPKKIMSKIDTMVEKRRKRRFDKICKEPVIISEIKSKELLIDEIDEIDEMDSEHDLTLDGMPENYEHSTVITNQLPLENDMSKEKSEYLSKVGLLSVKAKNNLLVDLCVKRQREIRCPAKQLIFSDLPERTKRIFSAMITTRGCDLKLHIGTKLRRNDLTEIEGLDRTSSRIKLTYMNTIGLAKKNRRTALYKMKSISNDDINRLQDLNRQYQNSVSFSQRESSLADKIRQCFRQQLMHDTETVNSMVMSSMKPYRLSKGEFMNCLGLSRVQLQMTACQ